MASAPSAPVAVPEVAPVAAPELVPEVVPEPAPEPTGAVAESVRMANSGTEPGAGFASMAAVAANHTETDAPSPGPSPTPPPATGDRDEQMAAIRQMLSDLKEGADAAPDPDPVPEAEAPPEPVTPAPIMRNRPEDEEEERDALKSRIDDLGKLGRAVKGEAGDSGYDAAKLRRLHERRAKRLQRSRERKKKSGGFLTGFTLVGTVTATMVGLYVMHPQIIAASPQMKPALTEYVVTVDRYRIELNQATAKWRAWLTERIGNLSGEE